MNNDKNKYGGLKVERVYTSDAIKDLLQDLEHKKIAIRSRNARIKELESQIEKMQEKLKADLIARLEEQMQYSTSPSCTKGMELFIRTIEEWEIKENG